MFYLRLFLQSSLSVTPNCTGFQTKREAENQKQSSNGGDFVLQLKLKMFVVTILLLPFLLRFRSLLPLTFDKGLSFPLHSLELLDVFIYTEINETKPHQAEMMCNNTFIAKYSIPIYYSYSYSF